MIEKIYFSNSKGNNICGVLSNPSSEVTDPVIILCHGFTSHKNSPTNIQLEKIFNSHNIATFKIDFFGHGESDGNFENITITEAVDDILNAITFLKNRGFSKLGLVGSSFGGMSSIMAATNTNDLSLLVLKSPAADYYEIEPKRRSKEEIENWESKGFIFHKDIDGKSKKLNYSFFADLKNNNAYEAAKKIKIPTLIVHGDEDKTVPVEQSKKISANIKNCKLEIIVGADHNYSDSEKFEKMLDLISKFVIELI